MLLPDTINIFQRKINNVFLYLILSKSKNKTIYNPIKNSISIKNGVIMKNLNQNNISIEEIEQAQLDWANGLIKIGEIFIENGNHQKVAEDLIAELYAYNEEEKSVLFKPTKASARPFRNTAKGALSYFVGGDSEYLEDRGFALAPWKKIVFNNNKVYIDHSLALAMGEYEFTDTKNQTTKVEYSFGYIKNDDGKLKIVLHHSSLPYTS